MTDEERYLQARMDANDKRFNDTQVTDTAKRADNAAERIWREFNERPDIHGIRAMIYVYLAAERRSTAANVADFIRDQTFCGTPAEREVLASTVSAMASTRNDFRRQGTRSEVKGEKRLSRADGGVSIPELK